MKMTLNGFISGVKKPSEFLSIKTSRNRRTKLNNDELANTFDPDKPCSRGLARNYGCHWQQQSHKHCLRFSF